MSDDHETRIAALERQVEALNRSMIQALNLALEASAVSVVSDPEKKAELIKSVRERVDKIVEMLFGKDVEGS